MSRHTSSAKAVVEHGQVAGSDGDSAMQKRRADLFALLGGAIDARINHLDYFDTVGGDELVRLFRQHRATRRDARAPRVPMPPAERKAA